MSSLWHRTLRSEFLSFSVVLEGAVTMLVSCSEKTPCSRPWQEALFVQAQGSTSKTDQVAVTHYLSAESAGLEPTFSIPGNNLLPFLQGKCQVAKMCQIWIIPHCYRTMCMCQAVEAQLLWLANPGCKGSTVLGYFSSQEQTPCTFLETYYICSTVAEHTWTPALQWIYRRECSCARAIRTLTAAFPRVWWMQAEGPELITVAGEASSDWHLSDNFTVPSASQETQIWLCDGPHWGCQFKARFRMPDWHCELCIPYGTCRLGTLEGC